MLFLQLEVEIMTDTHIISTQCLSEQAVALVEVPGSGVWLLLVLLLRFDRIKYNWGLCDVKDALW